MRITSLEAIPYALPFERPYVTARGRLERREMVLVRLRTDEGPEGVGEAVPLSLRGGGASLETVLRELREPVASALIGADPLDSRFATSPVSGAISAPTAAAVEVARLDLAAKLAGVPLWRVLGAASAGPVECNATLVAGPPRAVAADAERWLERGFSTFKLKVGVPGDVGQVEAVRAEVGAQARIRVDANGVWSPEEAVIRLTAMERHGLELAEQPAEDLEGLAVVRSQTAVPIAADESVASPEDAGRAVAAGACQLATAKLVKAGGIEPVRRIAAQLPVYLSSALDGPVGIAAAAHAAQALRDEGVLAPVAQGLATQLLFADTVASIECEMYDGLLRVPDGPGLGVEIDEAALERHRL
ncbi:MAG TPA: mandelate racemase/muconate lactonizing enzyme family protein [Solirubrobacterales bacterium]|jgi:muconate cycloisomerase